MSDTVLARWELDADTQAGFVALSGDTNPLHTDPLAARRLPFGRVAAHGVHLALETLERLVDLTDLAPARIRATFRQPVGIGDIVMFEIDNHGDSANARLTTDGRVVADVRIDLRPTRRDTDATSLVGTDLPPLPAAPAIREWQLDELVGVAGSLPLLGDRAAITERFASLTDRIGCGTVAELLAVTRLVGIEVPGLHSLLSSFDVAIDGEQAGDGATLDYAVDAVDARFSSVVIGIEGPTVRGSITSFLRQAPVDPIIDTSVVAPNEFGDLRVLVVGGSRGLGAAAAQLLAAGDADVRLTYRSGADDAARVAASCGADAFGLDADADLEHMAHDLRAITDDGWQPTHLAWFASPPIFVGGRDTYSQALFERFRRVYVDAFLAALEQLRPERLVGVLWPSSDAVTVAVAGLAEYSDAKRLGESACRELAAAHPHLVVDATRFPRLRTDQTATFMPIEADHPAPHVLAALRRLAGQHAG